MSPSNNCISQQIMNKRLLELSALVYFLLLKTPDNAFINVHNPKNSTAHLKILCIIKIIINEFVQKYGKLVNIIWGCEQYIMFQLWSGLSLLLRHKAPAPTFSGVSVLSRSHSSVEYLLIKPQTPNSQPKLKK